MTEPKSAARGFVYCVYSPAQPHLYKIGCSTKHPMLRIKQLSAATSVAAPFVLAYHRFVQFPFDVEAKLHEKLAQYRVNDSREFFMAPLYRIIEEIEKYDALPEESREDLEGEYSFAWLFSSFPDDGSARELDHWERQMCRELERRVAHGQVVY